jgi:uncharacterized protein
MSPPPGAGLVVERLPVDACHEKLRKGTIGRLAVSLNALPVVVPVNFAVDGNWIVIRTTPWEKIAAVADKAVVAFEIDEFDTDQDKGWSVLVQGRARSITTPSRLARARSLPLRPITADGADDTFIAIEMEIVTGHHVEPMGCRTEFS